jgi:hypothetical protein
MPFTTKSPLLLSFISSSEMDGKLEISPFFMSRVHGDRECEMAATALVGFPIDMLRLNVFQMWWGRRPPSTLPFPATESGGCGKRGSYS